MVEFFDKYAKEEVNDYVKQLLVYFHGRCLWLDRKISMDMELIASIIGLALVGVDPTPFFIRKDQDTTSMN